MLYTLNTYNYIAQLSSTTVKEQNFESVFISLKMQGYF